MYFKYSSDSSFSISKVRTIRFLFCLRNILNRLIDCLCTHHSLLLMILSKLVCRRRNTSIHVFDLLSLSSNHIASFAFQILISCSLSSHLLELVNGTFSQILASHLILRPNFINQCYNINAKGTCRLNRIQSNQFWGRTRTRFHQSMNVPTAEKRSK